MKPILISKKQHRDDDIILLSRKENESVVRRTEKVADGEIYPDLKKAIQQAKEGKLVGPFETVDELMNDLRR